MSRTWTKEQLDAINSPSQNILVSAGAGSGKTAVLTERVITLLNKGVNINELLVLTFTNAAAAEMKDRIRKAIKKNDNLKEQLNLLDSAYITTFDSFALSLVKKYHYLLGISNNVSIVNEAALKLEKYRIIDEVMEENYVKKNSDFLELIKKFCLKNDDDLKKLIFEINNKFDLIIEKEDFLDNYSYNLNDEKINKLWNDYLNDILSKIDEIKELYQEMENSLETAEDEEFFELASKELEVLLTTTDYNTIVNNLNFTLPNKRKNISDILLNNKKKMNELKNKIKDLIIFASKEKIINALKENLNYERELISIIKEINERINNFKYSNEMFEFMDIAKLAIKLVKNNPSICEELKSSFKEIMLDEYQDTSDIQEVLMSYISNNNVYMVGDIKQSIYRFRNANPNIFLDKYDTYSADSTKGKVINLMRNFRSRKEVLDDINVLFNKIMEVSYGGVNYSKGHEFIFGNLSYDDHLFSNQSNNLEIYNYNKEKGFEFTNDEIEAFIIGNDIKNKIKNNYMIYDKDSNSERKLQYGDITILIDRKDPFDTFLKVFEYLNIPMSSYKNNNLVYSDELLCFKNIYKLIIKYNNKEFDDEFKHSFMSVARSFLFEYSDDYLFNLITNNEYYSNDIYTSLRDIIDNYNYLSIIEIHNLIIETLDVFYKARKCSNIEDITSVIHYLSDLMNDFNSLNYTLDKVVEYFDDVINRDFKIELPVRKNSMNSVKIMTIHASKGLEFNICYFAGFNKKFSEFDSKKAFIYDDEYGLLLPLYIDNEKYNNIGKKLYLDKYYKEEISEKIRLLYVALSRAKEKMIIVGNFNEDDKKSLSEVRKFNDLIGYAKGSIERYFKNIDLNDYEITNLYKFYKSNKNLTDLNTDKIINKQLNIKNDIVNESSFSKKQLELINEDIIDVMNKGNLLHGYLQKIDFHNPNLNNYSISINDKKIIERFLSSDILKNVSLGKIYKEYEFMYEDNNELKHGFIDLMIVYDGFIDIIDYKLSNIDDEGYIKQLNGYKNYIENITNKKVNLYLYSLFTGNTLKVG